MGIESERAMKRYDCTRARDAIELAHTSVCVCVRAFNMPLPLLIRSSQSLKACEHAAQ